VHIRDFDFDLPQALIAQEPLTERDASRLLVLTRATGLVRHQVFRDLPDLLNPGDLVVVNRSRVIPARLLARRARGEPAEILLVRAVDGAIWDALLRPGRRIRAGDRLSVAEGFDALVLDTQPSADGRRRLELQAADGDWRAAIERHGHVPLPPYVERADTPADRERYQSVYAREAGSVAAPTAGLHFTPELLGRLAARGIERAEIVLHVGPGTFRPVKVDDVSQHTVDPEPFEIPPQTAAAISRCRARGGRVVSVGTTTTRTLESVADGNGNISAGAGDTDLVLLPGYRFRATDVLLTNFHLPRSSLLLLVAAFAGRERILAAYADAVRLGYRFYSYGDAMLILP
jgi:S-adenosylmethionine:tRNA ribosyltransferase-isomerase